MEPVPTPFSGSCISGGGPDDVALNLGTGPLADAVMVHGVGGKYCNGAGTVRRLGHVTSSLGDGTSVGGRWSQMACARDDGMFLAGLRCDTVEPSGKMWSDGASARRW